MVVTSGERGRSTVARPGLAAGVPLHRVFRDLLQQLRPFVESPAKRGDKIVVARSGLRPGRLGGRFGKRRRGVEPKADEQRQCLDTGSDIALEPRQAAILQVEPFGENTPIELIRRVRQTCWL